MRCLHRGQAFGGKPNFAFRCQDDGAGLSYLVLKMLRVVRLLKIARKMWRDSPVR